MREISELIAQMISTYGFGAVIVIFATILVTNLAKIPYVRWAEKQATARGISKTYYTRWLCLMPLVCSFLFTFFLVCIRAGWDMSAVSWHSYAIQSGVYAGLSISVFEIIKNFVKTSADKQKG